MSLFVCMECGCVENTNCNNPRDGSLAGDHGFPNLHTMEMHGFDAAYEASGTELANRTRSPQRMLCSECNTGTWHGEWEKHWPSEVELAMANDLDDATYTSHPLFKGSYNNEMDDYTLEQFNEDNRTGYLHEWESTPFQITGQTLTINDFGWAAIVILGLLWLRRT